MSNEAAGHLGIVVRADGTVPFDDNCHPDVRAKIITHLVDHGLELEGIAGTKHMRVKGWGPDKAAKIGGKKVE